MYASQSNAFFVFLADFALFLFDGAVRLGGAIFGDAWLCGAGKANALDTVASTSDALLHDAPDADLNGVATS